MSKFNAFFSMDGPLYKFGSLLIDLFLSSLFWSVLSGIAPLFIIGFINQEWLIGPVGFVAVFIVLILIGPATTASFYILSRRKRHLQGFSLKEFFSAYRESFVPSATSSAVLNLVLWLGFSLLLAELSGLWKLFGDFGFIFIIFQGLIILLLCMIELYSLPMLARFNVKVFACLQNALFMSVKNILITLCLLVITSLEIACIWFAPFLLIVVPGLGLYAKTFLLERVFQKYIDRPSGATANEPTMYELSQKEDDHLNPEQKEIVEALKKQGL